MPIQFTLTANCMSLSLSLKSICKNLLLEWLFLNEKVLKQKEENLVHRVNTKRFFPPGSSLTFFYKIILSNHTDEDILMVDAVVPEIVLLAFVCFCRLMHMA